MSSAKNESVERIACYVRVSTEEQKLHGISLDAQRDKLKEYASKHNLKIVGWYEDEGISGRKLIKNRPALQRMLNDAHDKKFDRIIFIKLDRFFRSVAEYHECMKYIDPVIWTATEEKYDLKSANGRAFVNMKLTIAELEADQTGERIKLVNEYKVKTGQAITGYKALTFGYTTKKIDGVKKVVKNPDTEQMVMDYIKHFLAHQNKQQAFRYARDKYNSTLGYNAFTNLLCDTKMYGHYRGNDNYVEDPYIDKATFEKIQEILNRNIKRTPSGIIYMFSGLMRCPMCGRNMASRSSIKPSGKTYVYYRCPNRVRERLCDYSPHFKEEMVEIYLLENLDKCIESHIEVTNVIDNRTKDSDVEAKIKKIKSEMDKVKRMYRKDDITESEYDQDMTELKASLRELEASLEPIAERDLSIYKELLESDWKNLYNSLEKEYKRVFWRKYIKEIQLNKDGTIKGVKFF